MITSSPQQHGIPEVPNHLDPTTQTFLRQLKIAVLKKVGDGVPARPIINGKVIPGPLANTVQWTRTDADYYMVYSSPTNDITKATSHDVGDSQQFTDYTGAKDVTRFYWVQACKENVARDPDPISVGSGKSLDSTVAAPIPTPPLSPDRSGSDTVSGHPLIRTDAE